MTVFSRLFKLFIIVIITPLFVMGVFLFYYQNYSKTEVLSNYLNLAQISAGFIKQNIENISLRFDFANHIPLDSPKKNLRKTLDDALNNNPDFVFLALLDKTGVEFLRSASPEISASITPVDLSSDPSLKRITADNIAISSFDKQAPFPFVELVYPLREGGYLFAVVNLFTVWDKFAAQPIGKTGGLYFAREDGEFFNFDGQFMPAISPQNLAVSLLARDGLIRRISDNNENIFVGAFTPTAIPGAYLLVLQYGKEAYYTINLISWLIVFFILAATTLSYFAALSFSQEVSGPVEGLTAAARKVAGNDFDVNMDASSAWGEFEILISTFNDMAARLKQYQAVQLDKLLDEKKKTDLMAGLMRDGVVMCTLDGRRLFVNKTAGKILASDTLCNTIKCAVLDGKKKPRLKDLLTLPSGTVFTYREDKQIPPAYFEMLSETFKPANEEEVAIIIFRDITVEHEIDEMKNDIFNAVAHDLRAPLLGLQAYIMVMSETPDMPPQKRIDMLNIMQNSSQTLTSLIENILDASKLERGLISPVRKDFDLHEAAQKVVDTLRPLAEAKGLELSNGVPANTFVRADRNLIERVLSNLFSNALKFTDTGGARVLYESADGLHLITVKDTGRGIKREELDKIFDKYHQSDKTQKGYGLGLAIAKQIVLAHNGQINAQSAQGKGASITFTLPQVKGDK